MLTMDALRRFGANTEEGLGRCLNDEGFYLELVSGLRKGELTALLWSDLDITDKTISVSK